MSATDFALLSTDLHKAERELLIHIATGEVYWVNGLVRTKGSKWGHYETSGILRRLHTMGLIILRQPSRLLATDDGRSILEKV